ncbi:hypothetical protein BGZ49_005632, partial [Haplosporangium sp. Z 27]
MNVKLLVTLGVILSVAVATPLPQGFKNPMPAAAMAGMGVATNAAGIVGKTAGVLGQGGKTVMDAGRGVAIMAKGGH